MQPYWEYLFYNCLHCSVAMAIALGNLYHDDLDVDQSDVAGVLAAADVLGFKQLMEG